MSVYAGKKGININCVAPSQTYTEMLAESMTEEEIKELGNKVPIGRIASVDDQVGPIIFLLSDLSSYVHGSVIDVNGGQL